MGSTSLNSIPAKYKLRFYKTAWDLLKAASITNGDFAVAVQSL
jgi:hypothetical protein